MTRGFKDNKGNFRPTRSNGRKSSRKKTTTTGGIEPREPFAIRERVRLLSEDELSRDFTFNELEQARSEIDDLLKDRYFDLNPDSDFFSETVAFDYAEQQGSNLDPDFDILLTELRKVNRASTNKVLRSMGGAQITDPEPTGFPEVDEMMR